MGTIVGAGIYTIIGSAAGLAGTALWVSMLCAGAAAFLTALSYAELVSMLPKAGAEYQFLKAAFPKAPLVSFLAGFLIALNAAAATLATESLPSNFCSVVQVPSLARLKTHAAPTFVLSPTPPTTAVLPSGDTEAYEPYCAVPVEVAATNLACCELNPPSWANAGCVNILTINKASQFNSNRCPRFRIIISWSSRRENHAQAYEPNFGRPRANYR